MTDVPLPAPQSIEATNRDNLISIGRGTQGVVELHVGTNHVRKRFRPGKDDNRALIQREYEYLERFARAVTADSYIRCPSPIRSDLEREELWMTYCPGVGLREFFAGDDPEIDEHLEHIAEQIVTATLRYVQEFGEPYDDLAPINLRYDPTTRILYVFDLTAPRFERRYAATHAPHSVTLGKFIGRCAAASIQLDLARHGGSWPRFELVATQVLERMQAHRPLVPSLLREFSVAMFEITYRWRRRPLQTLWMLLWGRRIFEQRSDSVLAVLDENTCARDEIPLDSELPRAGNPEDVNVAIPLEPAPNLARRT